MLVSKRRVISGLSLQAVALLVVYVAVVWLYSLGWFAMELIAFPLYVWSIFRLMKSGARVPLRLLLSFWPLLIPVMVEGCRQAVIALQWRMVRTEVFLIPAGYHGSFAVRFDEPQGSPPLREAGRAVFTLGPTGELHTRDHAPWAHVAAVNEAIDARREFYFVDHAGNRVRIPAYRQGQPDDQTSVFWEISYDNFQPGGNTTLEDSHYKYYWFFVGTSAQKSQMNQ
jgi:hypothetical protein